MTFSMTELAVPQRLTRQRLLIIMIAILAMACAIGVLRIAFTLDLPVVYGSDEGWSAYHQAEAAAGISPYPASSSLMYNVYPPLSFYIVGAVGRLINDNILAGRIISLLAFLLTALGVAKAARQMGCTKREAGFAALLLMTGLLYDHDYVGTNTPQMIGQAFGIAGLILCLRQPRTGMALFFSALFFVLAGFTKHNLVAQPITAAAWLLLVDRRSGFKFVLFGGGLTLLGLAAFQLTFGHSVWSEINSSRVWAYYFSLRAMAGRIPEALVPVLASVALLRWFPKDRYLHFCLLYLAISIVSATYFLGGAGTGGNMLSDAEIAVSLCGGLGLHLLSNTDSGRHSTAFAACYFLPLLGVVMFTAATGRFPRYWLDYHARPVVDARKNVAFLKDHDGPALCREQALCFRAGKPVEADLWNLEQAVTLGRRDGHELREAIEQRRYAVLQLYEPPNVLGAPPEVQVEYSRSIARAVEANYRIDHTDFNGTFWVRRPR
jgi:hypothetical protein